MSCWKKNKRSKKEARHTDINDQHHIKKNDKDKNFNRNFNMGWCTLTRDDTSIIDVYFQTRNYQIIQKTPKGDSDIDTYISIRA